MQYTREGREVTYIHYMKPGDYAFRHELFCKLSNDGHWVKPKGGLFEKMVEDGWDGLEISISDYAQLYNYLYGWDCDSIVVFNEDAIVLC